MRIFLICLLAAGAIAVDSTEKTAENKHQKRGVLTGDHGVSNLYSAQQIHRYVQPGHQQALQSGLSSSYTSGQAYTSASLPVEHHQTYTSASFPVAHHQTYTSASLPVEHHQTYTNGGYDNVLGQSSIHQAAGQGYDQSTDFQGQQLGQDNYAYNSAVSGQTIGNTFGHVAHVPVEHNVQVPVSHPVPVEVARSVEIPVASPVQTYVTNNYPIHVDRAVHNVPVSQSYGVPYHAPAPVSVPHQVPVHVDHQESVNVRHQQTYVAGDGATFGQERQESLNEIGAALYQSEANHGGLEHQLGGYEQINAGSQQYNFGQQDAIYTDAASLINDDSDSQSSGYHYDRPIKKFTF